MMAVVVSREVEEVVTLYEGVDVEWPGRRRKVRCSAHEEK